MPTQRTNRRQRSFSEAVERPTGPDNFLDSVAERAICPEHNALLNVFCFDVEGLADGHRVQGVCNARAKRAGMNGTINPMSLTRRPYENKELNYSE